MNIHYEFITFMPDLYDTGVLYDPEDMWDFENDDEEEVEEPEYYC